MSGRQIKVTVSKIGKPTIEAVGFSGGSCKEATASLLGKFQAGKAQLTVVDKAELYEEEPAQEFMTN